MKTATIISYHVFGTKNTNAIEITCKGRQLYRFMNNNSYESDNIKTAIAWAKSNGFTHFKIVYN